MGIGAYIYGFEVLDYHTETADTVIDEPIQAQDSKRLVLLSLAYLCAATAHTISFMYAKDNATYPGSSRNTASAAAAAAQAVINVTTTPRDPAGNAAADNDIVAYQCSDGTWEFNIIASVSTKAITHDNNLAKAVLSGAKYLIFGVVADGANLKIKVTASVENKYGAADGGSGIVLAHPYIGEPFYVSINNATAAGFLNHGLFGHIDK